MKEYFRIVLILTILFISLSQGVYSSRLELDKSLIKEDFGLKDKELEKLKRVYEFMKIKEFKEAEILLEELYKKNQKILPLWTALLMEMEDYDKINRLVKEKIVSKDHEAAILAKLYDNREKLKIVFNKNRSEVEMDDHFMISLPRIEVKIGENSYYFVIDTGASTNLITESVAKDLNMKFDKNSFIDIDTSTENIVKANLGILPDFKISEINIKNANAIIVKDEMIKQKFLGIEWYRIDGIIGWSIIKKLNLHIDFKNEKLIINKPIKKVNNKPNLFWLFEDPMVLVKTQKNNNSLFFLDSGAMDSNLTNNFLDKFSNKNIEWEYKEFDGLGGKAKKERVAEIGPIHFSFKNSRANFDELEIRPDFVDCKYINYDGRLGIDVAKEKIMIIDYSNSYFDIK